MPTKIEETINAVDIGSQTLVGVGTKRPTTSGNCFDILTEDGRSLKVLNFYVENLRHCLEHGVTWPIKIVVVEDHYCYIHDERIPHDYYRNNMCTVCAPYRLWDKIQQLEYQRKIMCGEVVERENCATYNFAKTPRLDDYVAPKFANLKYRWVIENDQQ